MTDGTASCFVHGDFDASLRRCPECSSERIVPAGDWLARLREKFKDDGLRRLAASSPDYYDSHGSYIPELAALMLAERAALAASEAQVKQLQERLANALSLLAMAAAVDEVTEQSR